MIDDLAHWTPRKRPEKRVLDGRLVRLEPLSASRHGDDLYIAATEGDADRRHAYLGTSKPESRAAFEAWLESAENHADSIYWSVIDKESGKAVGRQSLMRIDMANGVIEIGDIHWGPAMRRSPLATEAFLLQAVQVFDDLQYRRFEWKLNTLNQPSHRAAQRFGFTYEGLFRQHMIVKGANRDTAWYAMIDKDWPGIRDAFERWLSPANFDSGGRQKARLEDLRQAPAGKREDVA